MTNLAETVHSVLRTIALPDGSSNLMDAGIARAISVDGDIVRFVLEITPGDAEAFEPVRKAAEAQVLALDGVAQVSAVLTAPTSQKAPPDLKPKARPERPPAQKIAGVGQIIAVASGKGGVGKSTVSANLACALAASGKRTGLLDADVYGPSQPQMMGLKTRPSSPDGKTIIPLQAHGVTTMSIGLMTQDGQALAWRGPMLMGALQQMLLNVEWGELDVLIVDLPPGTGDVQMSLAQKVVVDGAIVVSTPQDVALIDARRGIDMFSKLKVPVLGLVENMSMHICSKCGHQEHIFGHGGVAQEAEKMGAPLLAELPLHVDIRRAADAGTPMVVAAPDSAEAQAYRTLADNLIAVAKL